jgi:hypothetical protein
MKIGLVLPTWLRSGSLTFWSKSTELIQRLGNMPCRFAREFKRLVHEPLGALSPRAILSGRGACWQQCLFGNGLGNFTFEPSRLMLRVP